MPLAAVASNSPAKPSAPPAAAAKSAPTGLKDLAASAGISVARLQRGLMAAKQHGGNSAAGTAALRAATGVSVAEAERIMTAVFGTEHAVTTDTFASLLAARLGVSRDVARRVLAELDAASGAHGVDPNSRAFAAIAARLGMSPAHLAHALDATKRSLAGK
ncbi:MAG TPA: hypothetical protein VFU35_01280 [Jatrophihabitans sp.]|nr:hypothetical protein [Jatrophihabitans sp.]